MLDAIREHFRRRRRLRVSMRDLARNGYCSIQLHGDVTWAQKFHRLFYGN